VDYNLQNPHVDDEDKLIPLTDKDIARIEAELQQLLNPKIKQKLKPGTAEIADKWYIDVYTIKYGYIKNSERRKNKGKSRKKMKRVKTVSFIKSMIAQPGMIQAFKEGRMGLSPKHHTFKLRREDPSNF
jgi:hypothetical protein